MAARSEGAQWTLGPRAPRRHPLQPGSPPGVPRARALVGRAALRPPGRPRRLRRRARGRRRGGDVHDARLYFQGGRGRAVAFRPTAGTTIPVPRHRRWLAIPGSVGQPRDGDTRAAYALVDFERERITFHRVAYDHLAVADRIERAGLPAALVYRMRRGV